MSVWEPMLIFSPFVLDATGTLLVRALRGENITQAHRKHCYQRAVLAGLGHKRTVFLEYTAMFAGGGCALYYGSMSRGHQMAVIAGFLSLYPVISFGIRLYERRKSIGRMRQSLNSKIADFTRGIADVLTYAKARVLAWRRVIVIMAHICAIPISNYLAFYLRFDGDIAQPYFNGFLAGLPALLVIRGVLFVPFRVYWGLWRYPSTQDLVLITGATLASTTAFFVWVKFVLDLSYPRTVLVVDSLILITILGGMRLTKKIYRQVWGRKGDRLLLIYGAGDAGEMIVRDIQNNPASVYRPIGFVDDDLRKKGTYIRGVPTLGTRKDLKDILEKHRPHELLIAIPSASPRHIRSIVRCLEHHRITIRILPALAEILDGKVLVNQARHIKMEDLLLRRSAVSENGNAYANRVNGKAVLVTGAGGSIGSELCRQIAAENPSRLVMLDRYENSLHSISLEVAQRFPNLAVDVVVGDITDAGSMEDAFRTYLPQIVFHAAAHKHVPLMENSPLEAVKNNIFGTKNVAEMAIRFGAERFILISTDKAVRASSIMGMTKRVAEMYVSAVNDGCRTDFLIVRFGNVLGSNGSVVPIFTEQIKKGGPVTVTHPDMKRFFMLIPEAVHLVLKAASVGGPGEILVLEMGDQIRVVDMARSLIRFMGYVPDEEIRIVFTGARSGEKLFEELYDPDTESIDRTRHDGVLSVKPIRRIDPQSIRLRLKDLEDALKNRDKKGIVDMLSELAVEKHKKDQPVISSELSDAVLA